jgi:hypothetical protein
MTHFKGGTLVFNADGERATVDLDRRDKAGGRLWAVSRNGWRRSGREELKGEWLEVNNENADLLDFVDAVEPETEPYWKERGRVTDRHQALRGYRRLVFAARSGETIHHWRGDLAAATGLPDEHLGDEVGSGDLRAFLKGDLSGGGPVIEDTPSCWPVVIVRGDKGEIEVGPPTRPETALDVLREIKSRLAGVTEGDHIQEAYRIVNAYLNGLDREEGSDD